jgi:hypothetical protein
MTSDPYMEMIFEIYPTSTGSADWRFCVRPNNDHGDGMDICYDEWQSEEKRWKERGRVGALSSKEMRLMATALNRLADYHDKERDNG